MVKYHGPILLIQSYGPISAIQRIKSVHLGELHPSFAVHFLTKQDGHDLRPMVTNGFYG